MQWDTIGIGSTADDGTGDTARSAGTKINSNFTKAFTQTILAKTANHIAVVTGSGDEDGAIYTFTSASATTLTLPNTTPAGWQCSIIQLGTAATQLVVTGGSILNGDSHTRTGGQNKMISLIVLSNAGTSPQVFMAGQSAL